MHREHGYAKGNSGGTIPVAETEGMRLRRECIEWIMQQGYVAYGNTENATTLMEHCFGVAAKLLGKEIP